ncbi:MAG: hypothetical protein WC595_04675 [Candidatus Nanoarchaeia archaeon]
MSKEWLKKFLVAIGISASLQGCASFSGTNFGKAVEKKGGELIIDANQRIVRKGEIVDRFELPPFKEVNKKEYLLVKVITTCEVTTKEGKFKETTIQGDVPKGISQRVQVFEVKEVRGWVDGKRAKPVTVKGVYIPVER